MPKKEMSKKIPIIAGSPLKMPPYKYQESERGSYVMKPLVKKITQEEIKAARPPSLLNVSFG